MTALVVIAAAVGYLFAGLTGAAWGVVAVGAAWGSALVWALMTNESRSRDPFFGPGTSEKPFTYLYRRVAAVLFPAGWAIAWVLLVAAGDPTTRDFVRFVAAGAFGGLMAAVIIGIPWCHIWTFMKSRHAEK